MGEVVKDILRNDCEVCVCVLLLLFNPGLCLITIV